MKKVSRSFARDSRNKVSFSGKVEQMADMEIQVEDRVDKENNPSVSFPHILLGRELSGLLENIRSIPAHMR